MRDGRLLKFAKRMRSEPTPFEATFWYHIRAKRFHGAKFRRQQVIGPYIVDFACRSPRMLAIELDGDSHASQVAYDAERTSFLEQRGYHVLRFTNRDIHENLNAVLTEIENALNFPLSLALSPEGERENGAL